VTQSELIRLSEVRMEGVGKRYGDHWAVADVSISIRPGEFYTLLGPSGCGKTTLLRLLAGFITPDTGRIVVDDEPIDAVPPWKRNLGMVFQHYALWPHLSVFENVAFGLRERGVSGEALTGKVAAALGQVGLAGFEPRRPSQLSGGQQQRVAVARAVAGQPSILLADEPTGNLDYTNSGELLDALWRSCEHGGQTIVLVTHDARAAAYADRILVMGDGHIQEEITLGRRADHSAAPLIARLAKVGL